jgi:hypothetical protein
MCESGEVLLNMNVLLAITDAGGRDASNFERTILDVPGIDITILCKSIEELHQTLRSPLEFFDLAILFAGSHSDLKAFVAFQELLEGCPLLLVLPDRHDDVCLMGHQLQPRFISYADSDYSDVVAVLRKMIERQDGEYQAGRAVKDETRNEVRTITGIDRKGCGTSSE